MNSYSIHEIKYVHKKMAASLHIIGSKIECLVN